MGDIYQNVFQEIFDKIPKEQDGDYIDEQGLLCCGKCKTRKQRKQVFPDEEFIHPIMCKCRIKEVEEEEKQRLERERISKIETSRQECFEEKLSGFNWSKDDGQNKKLSDGLKKYCKEFEKFYQRGIGLILYGDVGRGKSFYAACIANDVLEQDYTVKYTSFVRIAHALQQLDGSDRQRHIDKLNRFDLLIIDDLGAERDTPYLSEIVYNVINVRSLSKQPIILTTNLTETDLKYNKDVQCARIYSRLLGMCQIVEVAGIDRRKEEYKNRFDGMKKYLDL